MTIIRYALEYIDYLVERFVACGPAVDALDLTSTTEHFWSSGPCDPIVSNGQGPRYTVKTVDVPDWLIAGLKINHDDVESLAVRIMIGDADQDKTLRALRYLTCESRPSKFHRSLMAWYETHGFLSHKQIDAVLYPANFRRYSH